MTSNQFRTVTVSALVVAVVAIVLQIICGADYPAVPPGPIILAVAAVLVYAVKQRWIPLVGGLVAGFIFIGGFIAPEAREHLTDPENAGVFLGTLVQMIALAVAVVCGVAASVVGRVGQRSR